MAGLVALDLGGSDRFVNELQRCWDDGDAVLPLDQRLSQSRRSELVDRLGATAVVSEDGRTAVPSNPLLPDVLPGDALVVATSGTTGTPKGVVLSHDAVAASARMTNQHLQASPTSDRYLACLPLAHIGGLAVVTRALLGGVPLTVHDGFEATAVEQSARDGATLTSLVVTALTRVNPSLFRTILLGGSAIPQDRPANTVATYGMTETGSGVVYDGMALPGVDVRVVNDEIQLQSPTLLRCYRDGTDPRTADGWFPTGDLGHVGADGQLQVHGRRGDMITSGGEKVWPARVEPVLCARADIAEAVIVGRPDPEWGQAVTAIIIPADPSSPPSLDQLRAELADALAPYELPKRIEIVDVFPRTGSGKIRRIGL